MSERTRVSTDPFNAFAPREIPQTEQADPDQAPNNAGGYAFRTGDDVQIHRFLTTGSVGGTYYVDQARLTEQVAEVVLTAARDRGEWLVEQILAVSLAGRAPRQNPGIVALAAVAGVGDLPARQRALRALPEVCRTGSTLLMFARYVEQFRGWGRGLRNAVGDWFVTKEPDDLAYQAIKYRQRDGWAMRDLVRLSHPTPDEPAKRATLEWITQGVLADQTPQLVHAFSAAQAATTDREWQRVLEWCPNLPWEAFPDQALNSVTFWQKLISYGVPQTALIRQLPRLTRIGVLDDSDTLIRVIMQLTDGDKLRKARVHPLTLLVAARTYAKGRSKLSKHIWIPNRRIIDALDAAFYSSFGTVVPSGKRTLVALDVSGSMGWEAGDLGITCREITAALSLVLMATEPDTTVVGFTSSRPRRGQSWAASMIGNAGISELGISPRQRLDDACRTISDIPFGGTDCALPALWATEQGKDYETIVIMTDNETWAGGVHPHVALDRYRQHVGHRVRQVVVGITATDVTIADPKDPDSMDIAGFDSAVPNLISDFSRGDV